jgi:hypothetical protein
VDCVAQQLAHGVVDVVHGAPTLLA